MTDTSDANQDQGNQDQGEHQGQQQSSRSFTQAEVDALIRDRLNRERTKFADYSDLKDKATKFDELEQQRLSDIERAQQQAQQYQAQAEQAQQALNGERLRNAVYAASVRSGAVDPDAVLALIDKQAIPFEDGKPVGIDDAVTALLESKPYLKATGTKPTGNVNGGPQGNGQPNTISRTQLRDPKFFSENRAEIFKAMAEGRITDD